MVLPTLWYGKTTVLAIVQLLWAKEVFSRVHVVTVTGPSAGRIGDN